MNVKLETPPAVLKAREAKKGMNWFLEILVPPQKNLYYNLHFFS